MTRVLYLIYSQNLDYCVYFTHAGRRWVVDVLAMVGQITSTSMSIEIVGDEMYQGEKSELDVSNRDLCSFLFGDEPTRDLVAMRNELVAIYEAWHWVTMDEVCVIVADVMRKAGNMIYDILADVHEETEEADSSSSSE